MGRKDRREQEEAKHKVDVRKNVSVRVIEGFKVVQIYGAHEWRTVDWKSVRVWDGIKKTCRGTSL